MAWLVYNESVPCDRHVFAFLMWPYYTSNIDSAGNRGMYIVDDFDRKQLFGDTVADNSLEFVLGWHRPTVLVEVKGSKLRHHGVGWYAATI